MSLRNESTFIDFSFRYDTDLRLVAGLGCVIKHVIA